MPEDDLLAEPGQTEEVEHIDFLVDERKDDEVCMTCKKQRVGSKVCGTYKATNDHYRTNDKPDIETWFKCNVFEETD